MGSKFKLNSPGVKALLNSAGIRGVVTGHAQKALARAKANAPVKSGAYRDGLRLEQATTDRAVARVVATARHSAAVEANTGNLRRSL